MSKLKICIIIISLIIVIGVIAIISISGLNTNNGGGGGIGGFIMSSVSFNKTYENGSNTIVTGFDFKYNAVKEETDIMTVKLNRDSVISIDDLKSDSECKIIIYKNNTQIWNEVISKGSVYKSMVNPSDEDEYVLYFIMSAGSGEGTITITRKGNK